MRIGEVAQRVRQWLRMAQSRGCDAIEECRLFDVAAPPARLDARGVGVRA